MLTKHIILRWFIIRFKAIRLMLPEFRRYMQRTINFGTKVGFFDILFALLSVINLLIMLLTTDNRYLDFGDGNYLYISNRLAEGAVIYKDILTPHPPILFIIGSFILKINNSLMAMRVFSIILGIATAFMVYMLSFKVFNQKKVAFLAGAIYYIMPIHLTWQRGFQADPLMVFFSLLVMFLIISTGKRNAVLASLFSVFAFLTKYSFLPALLFTIIYLYIKSRRTLKYYLTPLLIILPLSFISLSIYSSGMFFWDTFAIQSMSPHIDILILEKNLQNFFSMEGTLLLGAVLGMLLLIKRGTSSKDYLIGMTLVSFIPLALILRHGTGLYILYGAEPLIAIFVAYFLSLVIDSFKPGSLFYINHLSLHWTHKFLKVVLITFFTIILLSNQVQNFYTGQFLNFNRYNNWSNAPQVRQVEMYIEKYTNREDFIISPPYFAFISQRKLLFDYSETWLWSAAYKHNDTHAIKLVEGLVTSLENRSIKIIILDFRIKLIAPIAKAIEENYQPIYDATIVENLESGYVFYIIDRLEVYVPKSQSQNIGIQQNEKDFEINNLSRFLITPTINKYYTSYNY